jgi:hypothetical protein
MTGPLAWIAVVPEDAGLADKVSRLRRELADLDLSLRGAVTRASVSPVWKQRVRAGESERDSLLYLWARRDDSGAAG